MPGLYRACEQVLERRRDRLTGRVSGWRPEGIRLNEAAVEVRSEMINVLSAWADVVADKRSVAGPGSLDVATLASFLMTNLDWLAVHPAGADFARELAGLIAAAGNVLSPDVGQRIELGRCVESGCDRTIFATIRTTNGASVHQVSCGAGHTWQAHQWLQLGWRLDRPNQRIR